jgi:hypothetical protein
MATFERAASSAGSTEKWIDIGGTTVCVRFAGPALLPLLMPAISHLERRVGSPELTILAFDSASTGVPMAPPPWGREDYGPKGEIAGFNDGRIRTTYQPGIGILNVFDARRQIAIYWVAGPEVIPWWESDHPFRTIVHWSCAPSSRQPLHSGAVGSGGCGVLVAGRSGAGKSTTTLACLEAGMDFVGDDYVLVDVDRHVAHGLYCTAKLEPNNLSRFPELTALISNADRLGTQKAMLHLNDPAVDGLTSQLSIHAIVLPRVTGLPDTTITATTGVRALSALAPTSAEHLPGYSAELFTKVGRLVRSLPCFDLRAGTDLAQIPHRISELIGELT